MPGVCCVPGCTGYKKARSRGVVFHSLPSRDPERCKKWLKAIQNPRFDENTPTSRYRNIKVCSQHFKPEDYEPDLQAKLLKTPPRKVLKTGVVPSVFCGDPEEELSASHTATMHTQAPSTATSTSVVSVCDVDSSLQWTSALTSGTPTSSLSTGVSGASSAPSPCTPVDSRATKKASHLPPPAELSDNTDSDECEDCLKKTKSRSIVKLPTSDKNRGENGSHSKTIVNDSCLMELFNKCQTCGETINKKKMTHCGAQTRIRWSCVGGHRGVWMSSPPLWEAFPEIHLLTALAILFSGGAFKHFRKWAKHLHLNFMGHKIFHEVQKAYVNPEITEVNRTVQERIFMKAVNLQPEAAHPHVSEDPLKTIKAQSQRKRKEAESLSRSEQQYQYAPQQQCDTTHGASEEASHSDSFEEMEITIGEDQCSSVHDTESETTELRGAAGRDDSCDEEVCMQQVPQRSEAAERLQECEEVKDTSQLKVKARELTSDQTDCMPELSSLQRKMPELKAQSSQPVVFNNQDFLVACPQITNNTEIIGSLGTSCIAGNSFAIVPAAATVTHEVYGIVHTSEIPQISNNPVTLPSVLSPAASSNQLHSDPSTSQTLSVPFPLPCFTVIGLESTETIKKQ